MKRGNIILMIILTAFLYSCDKIIQENNKTSNNEITEIIDPISTDCFELNNGQSFFNNPIELNKDFRGKIYLQASIDTASMELTKIRIIRADLFTKIDTASYLKFVDTNFSREPVYPTRLENILPQIKMYIEKVEVRRVKRTIDCEVNNYQIPLKIE